MLLEFRRVLFRSVVELYLTSPVDPNLTSLKKELKAYAKTSLLEPGESQILQWVIKPSDLASFNSASSAWIVGAGDYELLIGASSRDIRGILNFTQPDAIITARVHNVLLPKETIEIISPDNLQAEN